MGELFGRIGWRCHFRPGDRLAIGFGLSMHAAGTPHLFWFQKLKGLTIIPIGAEAGTEKLLSFIKLFKANILSCTPSLAAYLIERSQEVLGEPVPMENGATGLAVFTPLEPESTIFVHNLRFTLNDIHQVFTEPCPCGMSGFRYKIIGRADDMLKVKGVPVYPASLQGVINGFIPRVTGAFRIVLDVPPPGHPSA
jgi:phenylacetate-coenzyme A ligase PaaK-like adenylate-forming protein